ncbi:MAG: signal peptidase II [Fimbriimonadaceae bacterium]|nr:signal peptidase II [Fimbriimonadaceae bacterium]
MNRRHWFWILFVGMIVLDQLVKFWARHAADGVEGRDFLVVWPNVLTLTLTYNHGIAFGMLQGLGVLLAPVAIGIVALAAWHSHKHPHEGPLTHVTLGLLAGGAVGNLIDRMWLGKVTDLFYVRAINFPVFNIADICITSAAILLVWKFGREMWTQPKESEAAAISSAEPETKA